jgi:hypothetical protein
MRMRERGGPFQQEARHKSQTPPFPTTPAPPQLHGGSLLGYTASSVVASFTHTAPHLHGGSLLGYTASSVVASFTHTATATGGFCSATASCVVASFRKCPSGLAMSSL